MQDESSPRSSVRRRSDAGGFVQQSRSVRPYCRWAIRMNIHHIVAYKLPHHMAINKTQLAPSH